ncbi:MAG: hypothetical protein HPY60_11470 [Candidatus Methanofastidiosum sp.]|nr:hypothetical protein [Methanofastidiosum sp.]
MNERKEFTDIERESLRFLERDFNNCFEQMRHYDKQSFNIFKFLSTLYTAIIGLALGLYQFGLKESTDLSIPATATIIAGQIIGLFLFSMSLRNRVYFVHTARYINEQREFFLKIKPLGFNNKSNMFTNPLQPSYFNWRSTQSWFYYTIAFMNASFFASLLYILLNNMSNQCRITYGIFGGLVFFVALISSAIKYFKSKEND